jgi:Replication-relaxation
MSTAPRSPRRSSDLLDVLPSLQTRDRVLLRLLSDHLVLTTSQITALLFSSARMCQHRLQQLHRLELVDRFSQPRDRRHGGSSPTHWALGRLGYDLHAAANHQPLTSARSARARLAQLAESPTLHHLLGVNQFFVDLAAHARIHPDIRLLRWWSERQATARFSGVHPDGHGLWQSAEAVTGFWLEYDTGAEDLPRLVEKLAAYEQLARKGGPTYPVLFWLHSRGREANLHQRLAGVASRCPIVTAARDSGTPHPAGPVWAVVGHDLHARVRLDQLACDHGEDTGHNPNWRAGRLILDQSDL